MQYFPIFVGRLLTAFVVAKVRIIEHILIFVSRTGGGFESFMTEMCCVKKVNRGHMGSGAETLDIALLGGAIGSTFE